MNLNLSMVSSKIEGFTSIVMGRVTQPGVLFLLILIAFILELLIFVRLSKLRSRPASSGFDRVAGLQERVDKLDARVGEVKNTSAKQFEVLKSDIGNISRELEGLREVIEAKGTQLPPSGMLDATMSVQLTRPSQPLILEDEGDKEPALVDYQTSGPQSEVVSLAQAPSESEQPEPVVSLERRLEKTRLGFFERIKRVFVQKPKLDLETLEELETQLITSDLGVRTVGKLIEEIRMEVEQGGQISERGLKALLKLKILSILEKNSPRGSIQPLKRENGPLVVMMVGVNGVGKTTTTAKLAQNWKEQGAKVMLCAADTFRAAAVDQLLEWGTRIGVAVVRGAEEAKPATVAYDAIKRAIDENVDVLIVDTAGRLHNKSNLMSELEGVRNAMQKLQPGAPHEVILVLDGSTGQNALNQAKEFNAAVKITGLVVTKLDGTPKGGIVVAIKDEFGIPIRYIGVGEKAQDLREFSARDFVEALFAEGA